MKSGRHHAGRLFFAGRIAAHRQAAIWMHASQSNFCQNSLRERDW